MRLSKKPVGPRVEKILKNRLLFFSNRKASCTLKKIKYFKSRKTAQLCGFCAFCLLLGGSTAVRHHLAKYKIQLVFLAVYQRVRLYNLLQAHFFDTLKRQRWLPLFDFWEGGTAAASKTRTAPVFCRFACLSVCLCRCKARKTPGAKGACPGVFLYKDVRDFGNGCVRPRPAVLPICKTCISRPRPVQKTVLYTISLFPAVL